MNRRQSFLASENRDRPLNITDEDTSAPTPLLDRHDSENTSAILNELEGNGRVRDMHDSSERIPDAPSSPVRNTDNNGDSMIDFCSLDWSKRIEESRRQDLESGEEDDWSSSEEGDEDDRRREREDVHDNEDSTGSRITEKNADDSNNNCDDEDDQYNDAKSYASNSEAEESYESDEHAEIKLIFGVVFWMLVQRVATKACEVSYKFAEKVFNTINRCCRNGKDNTDHDVGNLQNTNNHGTSANANAGSPNQQGTQGSGQAGNVASNMAVAASQSAAGAGGT